MKLFVGTTKGLLIFKQGSSTWQLDQVHFRGLSVSMLYHNPIANELWVGLAIKHWGPKLFHSTDNGASWQEKTAPKYPKNSELAEGKPAVLQLIWSAHVQKSSDLLWIGTEPGGLFWSDDQGASFHLDQELWDHPSRKDHWFGGGRNNAGIHCILSHGEKLVIGVSCGGVFVQHGAGTAWQGMNSGLRADYLPNPHAEYGHDPHAMALCQANPQVIWQQNHCGVFKSIDGGKEWVDVTAGDDFGRYGFALAIDSHNPERAWIIPAESDEQRVAKDLKLVVCRTIDGGKSWDKLTSGLPQENCFDLVFRHGLTRCDSHMCFGTTNGNLFYSEHDGEHWELISGHLPAIHSTILIN